MHCTECFMHCIECCMHCIECCMHCTECCMHCIECCMHCTECCMHCIECCMHCIERFMHCIECFMHCIDHYIECCMHCTANHLIIFSGLPDDMIEKGKDIKSVSEIEQNGDQFKVTVTTGPKVLTNSFTVGQEAEIETLTGEKMKAVVNKEGNKLKVVLNKITSITELVDENTLVNVSEISVIISTREVLLN
uniref:Fatty acid binding protein 1 n=1 Tax=Cyprinus carpio TaxID=7962 RepID=A0A8C1JZU4_CYPCA